jgi:hypothetical protein
VREIIFDGLDLESIASGAIFERLFVSDYTNGLRRRRSFRPPHELLRFRFRTHYSLQKTIIAAW